MLKLKPNLLSHDYSKHPKKSFMKLLGRCGVEVEMSASLLIDLDLFHLLSQTK